MPVFFWGGRTRFHRERKMVYNSTYEKKTHTHIHTQKTKHTISRSHPSYYWRAGNTAARWHNSRQIATVRPSTTNRDHTTHEMYEVCTSVFIVWHAERQPTHAEFELWRHLGVRSQSHSHPGFQRALQEKQLQMPQWNLEYRVIGLWLSGCLKSCHWLKLSCLLSEELSLVEAERVRVSRISLNVGRFLLRECQVFRQSRCRDVLCSFSTVFLSSGCRLCNQSSVWSSNRDAKSLAT